MKKDPQTKFSDLSNKATQSIPSIQGEESVSGSESDPNADDDTLENAKNVGQQLHEDEEHPKEIDIARDINKAEEYKKDH